MGVKDEAEGRRSVIKIGARFFFFDCFYKSLACYRIYSTKYRPSEVATVCKLPAVFRYLVVDELFQNARDAMKVTSIGAKHIC